MERGTTNKKTAHDAALELLDEMDTIVYVCDAETQQILYANKMAVSHSHAKGDYHGRTCYDFMFGREKVCRDCQLRHLTEGGHQELVRHDKEGDRYFSIDKKGVVWDGHLACAHFIKDVTEKTHSIKALVAEKEAEAKAAFASDAGRDEPSIGAEQDEQGKKSGRAQMQDAHGAEAGMDLSGRRVLLAEDNELNRKLMKHLLRRKGLEVVAVEDGQQAVATYAESEDDEFVAVLLDMLMPVMNGCEAARAIRAMSREDAQAVPILAISGDADEQDVKDSAEAGMDAHLSKPVEINALMARLEELVKE